jgi:pantothenate kinase
MPAVQALPMDGFHFPNAYLARTRIWTERGEVDLRSVKGSPETYDVSAFADRLRAVRRGGKVGWPYYDRRIHDPVDGVIEVRDRGILLVEGNFLLLDEEPWRKLAALADFTIFIESAVQTLADALPRLQRGGRSPEAALEHHRLVDHANYRRVLERRVAADLTLLMNKNRVITIDKWGAARWS